jgi:hypothetical protein
MEERPLKFKIPSLPRDIFFNILNCSLKKKSQHHQVLCFSLDSCKSILGRTALYAAETDTEFLKFRSALSSSRFFVYVFG